MNEQYDPDDLSSLYMDEEELDPTAVRLSQAEIDARLRASSWGGSVHAGYMGQGYYERQVELSCLADEETWDEILSQFQAGYINISPNSFNPDENSWNTLVHKAAKSGASSDVVQKLIDAGGWRSIRNAQGDRPIDIARQHHHEHLYQVLEPVVRHPCTEEDLMAIQRNFHQLIKKSADDLEIDLQGWFRYPELNVIQELVKPEMDCAVSGMYGGFEYRLEFRNGSPVLITEYSSRICSGSEELYEITPDGCQLIEGEW